MGVTVKIEIGEIHQRVGRSVADHLTRPDKASEALSHFNVRQVGRMELVVVAKKTGLDAGAGRIAAGIRGGPRRRRRSPRLTRLPNDDRGGRLQRDALPTADPGQHLVARRSRSQSLKFGQEEIGERLS